MPDPVVDPSQLSSYAKDIMRSVRVAMSASDLMRERFAGPKNPKNAMEQFFSKQTANKQAGKISRELSNYFRSETFSQKRLAIEQQAQEMSKPKLEAPQPDPPISGGESSVLEPKKKGKLGKPDAIKVVASTRHVKDKARLRQRIIEASNKRRHRAIQGVVVPKRAIIQGRPIGQLPSEYSGLVRTWLFCEL